MAKETRRVKMTKSLLCGSFLTLLQEKPLPRITVKEICEGADVNRSTYYAYYTDPYDQLRQMVQTYLQEQTVYMDTIMNSAGSGEAFFEEVVMKMLQYGRENKQLLQVLLGEHGDPDLEKNILMFFAKIIFPDGSAPGAQIQQQDFIYHACGSFGLMRWWIMQDCGEPPEALAHRIAEMTRPIRAQFSGSRSPRKDIPEPMAEGGDRRVVGKQGTHH